MEWWHELAAFGILGVGGYLYKVLIDNRFNAMFTLTNKNHIETLAKLEGVVTVKDCDKTHKYEKAINDEKIERIEKDLNGLGTKLDNLRKSV